MKNGNYHYRELEFSLVSSGEDEGKWLSLQKLKDSEK